MIKRDFFEQGEAQNLQNCVEIGERSQAVQQEQALEVHVGPVHDVERAGFGHEQVQYVDIMQFGLGDVDERRTIAAQVQQGVQLDAGLGGAEQGPGKHGQAQIDGGAVLLKACDEKLRLSTKLADCLSDGHQQSKVAHSLEELFRQRLFGIACGHADGNDAARLAGIR